MIVRLKNNIKTRILNGHPWIYDNEIDSVENAINSGDIVDVFHGGNFIGKGYFNKNSLIRVRIISKKNTEINYDFFYNKIKAAYAHRQILFPGETTFRVIFGEGDGLPGLIVDKFEDYLVIQINTLGIYNFKTTIVQALINIFKPKGIFEKDDEKSSKKEVFEFTEGWIYGSGPEIIPFSMNGIKFFSDTMGQKTGFFLDQRINARENMAYVNNLNVLDAFSYTGNFGIHALKGGAKKVTFIDYSERALSVLEETIHANGFEKERYEIINANTFDYLRLLDDAGTLFDFTIIDPPSLAKSRDSKSNAFRGYKELNLRAMKITKNGGFLSTSSCTQIIYEEDFKKIIYDSAENTKRKPTLIFRGFQSPDHPIAMNIFETEYLKHMLFRIDSLENY
ncbi:MAG: class I SAM-dependent rRNA methyltransferase [Thermotogae bacterium]|nr:class I SAM-dependent rRNA methyltransferase [Thermotogota bacterium]